MKSKRTLGALLLIGIASILAVGSEAQAIIGRPLTPMSYAGVARRSVRRGAYVGGAAVGAAAVTGVAVGAAARTALPVGCAVGVPCGGVVYQEYYSGPQVVYAP